MQITTEGRPYLCVPLGTDEYIQSFVSDKVNQWSSEVSLLANIAHTQPHAAYAAFTHGMTSKWSYMSSCVKCISSSFQPLELAIRTKLILYLTGSPPPNDTERELLALPAQLCGLALSSPACATDAEYHASTKITVTLQSSILHQEGEYTTEVIANQLDAKKEVKKMR